MSRQRPDLRFLASRATRLYILNHMSKTKRSAVRSYALVTAMLFATHANAQPASPPPPKHEVRAVWIATANGLDWPGSTDRVEQQSSLRKIIADLAAAHFNTILFQVRARGDAYYRSTYEPWAENLTGTLGKDPGWDPLEFLLNEAHRAGLEVHAWFNVYKIRGAAPVGPSIPPHPSRAHALWTVQYEGETWFDPGLPDVRDYLLNVALDLIQHYTIDGINLDYVRYPSVDFPDQSTYRRYGRGADREQWRRKNITEFVTDLYERATALKPMLKVGSSPLGIFDNAGSTGPPGSYWSYYQDARGWLLSKKEDYLSPQTYWPIESGGNDFNFVKLVRDWQGHTGGRQIYTGIGAYKAEIARQIPALIDSARRLGAAGEVFFRYENLKPADMLADGYQTIALIPSMPWKDSLPPNPPPSLAVSELAPHIFHLEWLPPRTAPDSDRARSYVLYRWPTPDIPTGDARSIIAVIPGTDTHYVDTVDSGTGLGMYYAVSAVDKGNNESASTEAVRAMPREAIALAGKISRFTTLVTSLSNGDGRPALAGYHLGARLPVVLELLRVGRGSADSLVKTLVDSVQDQGAYVCGLRDLLREPGMYLIRLKAGGTVLDQSIIVKEEEK